MAISSIERGISPEQVSGSDKINGYSSRTSRFIKTVLDLSWCAVHPHKTREILWLRMREEFGYTEEVRNMDWIRPMSSRDIYKRLKDEKKLSIL